MAQSCSKGSVLAASWINTCFQGALRHTVSYGVGEGIKLSCQLLEDRETYDRWHLVDAFACWFFINVCPLPFKEVAKKKASLSFSLADALELWEAVKNGESLAHPWERVVGKLSWAPPVGRQGARGTAGREPAGRWGWRVLAESGKPTHSQSPEGGNPPRASPKAHRACCNRKAVGQSTSLKKIPHPASGQGGQLFINPFISILCHFHCFYFKKANRALRLEFKTPFLFFFFLRWKKPTDEDSPARLWLSWGPIAGFHLCGGVDILYMTICQLFFGLFLMADFYLYKCLCAVLLHSSFTQNM